MANQQIPISFSHVAISERANKSFDCNELTLINKGTQNATINDCLVLNPGQSITYYALPYEINRTIYSIVFPTNVNGCLIIAVCKKYMQ